MYCACGSDSICDHSLVNNLTSLTKRTSDILIYYLNVRGLRTKLQLLKQIFQTLNFDIIILLETWLTSAFKSSELSLNDFDIFRCDRRRTQVYSYVVVACLSLLTLHYMHHSYRQILLLLSMLLSNLCFILHVILLAAFIFLQIQV